jgi:hypothetical protein
MASADASYGTASIGGTAALLIAARGRREGVFIQNNHATQTLHLGNDANVTTANGLKVAAGGQVNLEGYQGNVYAIGSGAATTVNYFEYY